ncbi:MAG: purine-nucleoside phosphorylase, partial [Comamonadaceae bacterium]|nr:purine-nucleoside phosphorylase [Comamonadaceae bacterium]
SKLIDVALEVARKENFAAHRGVFVAVPGPNLETRAEYRFLRLIGADAVGQEDKGSPGSTRIACRRPVLLAYRKDIG